jgi:Holliday junction DNA helicase RuvA
MIGRLKGLIADAYDGKWIVDVGGVGYEVTVMQRKLPFVVGSEVVVYTYTHVREDAIQLFGFETLLERDLFLMLTSVSGIGPKIGMAMMTNMRTADLLRYIQTENEDGLSTIPGIGLKTAKRIILELKSKVDKFGATKFDMNVTGNVKILETVNDATMALVSLGYKRHHVDQTIHELTITDDVKTQWIVKEALKKLGRLQA